MNKIKNIAHVTRIRIRCQSLVLGFVTVFCLVHIVSHFFQGNLWHQILQTGSARLPMSQWLLRMVCSGSFAYLAKTNLCQAGENFRTTAKAYFYLRTFTYEKNKDPTLTASGSNSQVQVTNKRTKDSSGPGASRQTRQCRPGAKRLTPEHPGRRLTYPDCDSC